MTVFVSWQLRVTLNSICNFCDVLSQTLDETINEGAEINTYLQIDDEEDNIQPSFYSFGTGEREVQVSPSKNV